MPNTREKLIELLESSPFLDVLGGLSYYEEAADHLIANGVTIPVRCKDCKHWKDGAAGCTDKVKCCDIGFYMIGENGYCSFGERR